MSERANFRGAAGGRGGGRGGAPGRGGRGDRHEGSGRGGGQQAHGQQQQERPKKENILDLAKYLDKRITVKFSGGREIVGTLKGYDLLLNLVLLDVEETFRDDDNNTATRPLGFLVARGTLLTSISPLDGSKEIANPFVNGDEDDE